jgi:hypothetical protein
VLNGWDVHRRLATASDAEATPGAVLLVGFIWVNMWIKWVNKWINGFICKLICGLMDE